MKLLKIKSITDVITNSSTEVFTIYNEEGIKDLKKMVNSILDIAYDSNPCIKEKLYFDDLFETRFSIEYDCIQDEIEEYIEENLPDKLEEYREGDCREQYELIEKTIPYEKLLEIAQHWDECKYDGANSVCGIEVVLKENVVVDRDLLDKVAKMIENVDSIFSHSYYYG